VPANASIAASTTAESQIGAGLVAGTGRVDARLRRPTGPRPRPVGRSTTSGVATGRRATISAWASFRNEAVISWPVVLQLGHHVEIR